jgi:outer membrane protein assembly factor BamB
MTIAAPRALTRIASLVAVAVAIAALPACDIFDKPKPPLPGERRPVLSEERGLKIDPEAAGIQVVLPRPTPNESWPQSGGFANFAMQHLAIGDDPKVIWTASVGSGSSSDRALIAPPVVADGRVFVKDARSEVSAFDAQTGRTLWRVTLQPPAKSRDSDEFGGGVVWYGGRLFVTTGFATVFSLDPATGKEVWQQQVSGPVRGSPTVFGDRVFAISIDNKLHALAAVDGETLWDYAGIAETAGLLGGTSPSAAQDIVVAPFSSGDLVALRTDNGRQLWSESLHAARRSSSLASLSDIRGLPVIDRGRVYAIGNAGQMAAIDLRSGNRIWELNAGGLQTPWAAGRFVYVVTGNAEVAAITRDGGKVKWVTGLDQFEDQRRKKPIQWVGPVLASDRLLVGSSTGEMLAISPYDGRVLGRLNLRSALRISPIIANETVYVLTDNGTLMALR